MGSPTRRHSEVPSSVALFPEDHFLWAEKTAIQAGTLRRLPGRRKGEHIQSFLPDSGDTLPGQGSDPPLIA